MTSCSSSCEPGLLRKFLACDLLAFSDFFDGPWKVHAVVESVYNFQLANGT